MSGNALTINRFLHYNFRCAVHSNGNSSHRSRCQSDAGMSRCDRAFISFRTWMVLSWLLRCWSAPATFTVSSWGESISLITKSSTAFIIITVSYQVNHDYHEKLSKSIDQMFLRVWTYLLNVLISRLKTFLWPHIESIYFIDCSINSQSQSLLTDTQCVYDTYIVIVINLVSFVEHSIPMALVPVLCVIQS